MTRKLRSMGLLAIALISLISFASCNNNDNPESPYVENGKKNTVLLYAIASNNLEDNLYSDKAEILASASQLDLENCSFYLYEVTSAYKPVLMKLALVGEGQYGFVKIKNYSSDVSSSDPSRLREVIEDLANYEPSDSYGLILWSHGSGVDYYADPTSNIGSKSDNLMTNRDPESSFGYDRNPVTGTVVKMNIDKLADAIPNNFFHFIWFDACYMSGIEMIYELKDKCEYFVGYPTEVFEFGLPYDQVMPYIVRPYPDLSGAAQVFFNYYAYHPNPSAHVATVAVVNVTELSTTQELCREAYASGESADKWDLQKYTRNSTGPFYDFNGYTRQMAQKSGLSEEWFENWQNSLDRLLVYKASTDYDFNGYPINLDQFCGISCYILDGTSSDEDVKFYQSLDWWRIAFN